MFTIYDDFDLLEDDSVDYPDYIREYSEESGDDALDYLSISAVKL